MCQLGNNCSLIFIRDIRARMNVPADPRYTWDNEIGAFTGMELIPELPAGTCECQV